MLMNDFPDNISTDINIFADDFCIWDTGLYIKQLEYSIHTSPNTVSSWCSKWGLQVSSSKSTATLFTKRRKVPSLRLKINKVLLLVKSEAKYLGVIFHSRLSFKSHSNHLVPKRSKRLIFMRLLSGTTWGASTDCLLTISRVLIRSAVEYGLKVFLFVS